MSKIKKIFFAVLVLIIFIVALSGCKECKYSTDCVAKNSCFIPSCVKGKCIQNPIKNCCGNGIVEEGENECTCPADAGFCKNKKTGSTFTEYKCINNKCVLSPKNPQNKRQSIKFREANFRITGSIDYNTPLNVREETFKLKLNLQTKKPEINKITIDKVEIYLKTKKGSLLISEAELNRNLWEVGESIEVPLVVDINTKEMSGTSLSIKLYYEYYKPGSSSPTVNSLEQRVNSEVALFKPDSVPRCNIASCDDHNPGTKETGCYPGTSICKYEFVSGECGNYICEGNENRCTCPSDCGTCERDYGTYVRYVCEENLCKATIKDSVNIQPITFKSSFDVRDSGGTVGRLGVEVTLNQPFNQKTDSVHFKIEMTDKGSILKSPVEVTKIEIMDKSTLVGEKTLNGVSILNVGSYALVDVPLDYYANKIEEKKSLKYIIHLKYSYVKTSGSEQIIMEQNDKIISGKIGSNLIYIKADR